MVAVLDSTGVLFDLGLTSLGGKVAARLVGGYQINARIGTLLFLVGPF